MQIMESGAFSRHQVMLLDDDEDMLELLKLTLGSRGLRAAGFRDPGALFSELQRARPVLVITDLQLDQCDGLEVCQRLADDYPQVALVVLSGDASKQQVALGRGADLFLTKPIAARALGDAVLGLLAMSQLEGGRE